jgi:DNA mismatch repair protein MutS2
MRSKLGGCGELEDAIFAYIDKHGEVIDVQALSCVAFDQELRSAEQRIKPKLEQITRTPSYQKMIQENLIAMRNGRYVIPIKQEYRDLFGGLIHDQSASGATLFIEPESVVQLTNQMRETKLKEEREIERILAKLTGHVSEAAENLKINIETFP